MRNSHRHLFMLPLISVMALTISSGWLLDAQAWAKLTSGLFVGFSIFGGAILTRMARTAPFSNPDVFTDENVEKYFVALRRVSIRLSILLGAILSCLLLLTICLLYSGSYPQRIGLVSHILSGMMGLLLSFIVLRIIDLIKGDFGFLELQRIIILDSRKEKAVKAAKKTAEADVAWSSKGGYGRIG